jgi:hypothetical protein
MTTVSASPVSLISLKTDHPFAPEGEQVEIAGAEPKIFSTHGYACVERLSKDRLLCAVRLNLIR